MPQVSSVEQGRLVDGDAHRLAHHKFFPQAPVVEGFVVGKHRYYIGRKPVRGCETQLGSPVLGRVDMGLENCSAPEIVPYTDFHIGGPGLFRASVHSCT